MIRTVFSPLVAAVSTAFAAGSVLAGASSASADPAVAVARVNGEPISLERYMEALGELHSGNSDPTVTVPQKDPIQLLERLVDIELILQEAHNIGLDALPDYGKAIEVFREDTLRGALLDRVTRSVPPPDPEEVDRRFREQAAEVEVSSLEFTRIEDAQAFSEALRRGDPFVTTAQRLVDEQLGQNLADRQWFRRSQMLPAVVAALDALEPGQASAPLPLPRGFAVLQFHGTRVADDPDLREKIEHQVRDEARNQAMQEYIEGLRKTYLKTDEEVLKSLDFDAEPQAFDAFLTDERVVVQVEGGDPVRVSDVARSVKSRMFHGVQQAAKGQRLNKAIPNVVEELSTERIIQLEARKQGLDDDPRFEAAVDEYERAILFGLFVRKVIDPSVEVRPEDVKSYYDRHLAEYTDPEMVRLESITFTSAEAAQRALERLNAGADLEWMRANASGLASPESIPTDLRYDRQRLLTVDSLPPGLLDAIAGAGAGQFRLYGEAAERHHVVAVIERVPATPRPLDSVNQEIAQRVFAEKREAVVKDWTQQLRAASEVEILVDTEQLRDLASGQAATP